MRHITRTSIAILGSAALIGGMAFPASAADVKSGENEATVVVEAGFLVLDTTAGTLTLDHDGVSTDVSKATGTLVGVNVSDMTTSGLGWTSTAELTNLTSLSPAATIDASGATYTSDVTAQKGTTVEGGEGNTVTAAVGGNNTATWSTTVIVDLPNTVKAGTYNGTLVHSLS